MVLCRAGDEVTVVYTPIRISRWFELMVVYVCISGDVMREADANETSGELSSAFTASLEGESEFRKEKIEKLIETASWLHLVSVFSKYQSEW